MIPSDSKKLKTFFKTHFMVFSKMYGNAHFNLLLHDKYCFSPNLFLCYCPEPLWGHCDSTTVNNHMG